MSRDGLPASWQSRLWRVRFLLEGRTIDEELLLLLEERAEALAMFAAERDAFDDPLSWRIDLYFRERPEPGALVEELAAYGFADLCADAISVTEVPPEDWVRAASAQRGPVHVGRFFVHSAGDRERAPAGTVAIELEAGLAFGSGEHESTRGCLLALDWLARRRRPCNVLDLGTGSGILAIAAARLWPCRVLAVDHDAMAVRVARENARKNRVAGRVSVERGDGYRSVPVRRRAPFQLVLANILADPLIAMAHDLRAHLAPGGIAVLSGLLDLQADRVERAHTLLGLRPFRRFELGRWTTLLLRRPRRRIRRR